MKDKSHAQIAWESYVEAVGGTSFEDKPLPSWEELGERQREGWVSAASSVYEAVMLENA